MNFALQLGAWGRPKLHFLRIFRPWGTLGGQNGPKTPPKRLWDPSRPQFSMKFDGFSSIFLWFWLISQWLFARWGVFAYFVKTVGSQSRKLPSRQGFRQHFWYFEFSFHGTGLKSKTFYIVRRCASVWRGPGLFRSCICGERARLKVGSCRSVFME